jgi:putative protein-disulfide isomerase
MLHSNNKSIADRIDITYYTDPLCCWSWAFEPHWQQLKEELEDQLTIRYCMTGLLESWSAYNDTVNSVSKPIQMGPVWMQASHISGVPIDATIWVNDPPASSYLACVAVKCAFLQSHDIGEKYLYALRAAVMQQKINVARQSNLMTIAGEIKDISIDKFETNLKSGKGMELFSMDLQEARYRNISRSPSLIINSNGKAIVLTGYRRYEDIIKSIKNVIQQ